MPFKDSMKWFEDVLAGLKKARPQNTKRKSKEELEDSLSDLKKRVAEAENQLAKTTIKMVELQAIVIEEEKKKFSSPTRRLEVE